MSSPQLSLPLAAPVSFKLLCTWSVLFGAGARSSSQRWSSTGQGLYHRTELLFKHGVSQWSVGSSSWSLALGAQDDSGSYCHVGSEVLGCPTHLYLGKCWIPVHSGPSLSADLLHSGCGAQRLPKPVDTQSPPPLLCSEAAWLLWSSVLGCGHPQSSLCCCSHVATSCSQSLCSLLLQCQRKDSMVLLLLQIMKLRRFSFFFFSNRILSSDQVEKSKLQQFGIFFCLFLEANYGL